MKKFVPILSVAVLIAAAGSAAGLARTKDAPTPTTSPSEDSEARLERFCSYYWGVMSSDGSYCRFEQTFHFNRTHVGSALLVTPVPVISGDSLTLLKSDDALPVVGRREYPTDRFVSDTEGYLSFRSASGGSLFSVKQVSLQRCFSEIASKIETIPCPK